MVTNIIILSHEHEAQYVAEIVDHIASNVQHEHDISVFMNGSILASDEVKDLAKELEKAQIAMIVISSSFLSDDILYELRKRAIELHEVEKLEAVQIIARTVYAYEPNPPAKRKLKTIPPSGTAFTLHPDRNEVYVQIIDFILDKIEIIKLKVTVLKLQKALKETRKT